MHNIRDTVTGSMMPVVIQDVRKKCMQSKQMILLLHFHHLGVDSCFEVDSRFEIVLLLTPQPTIDSNITKNRIVAKLVFTFVSIVLPPVTVQIGCSRFVSSRQLADRFL